MLIKEYRIPLPLTVDEYRIAQLYMIQKKSREESEGEGSAVEILKNHPYSDGPNGSGQYTYKVYHIGRHLPNWFRNIAPKTALEVHEESWNAYPYTKTRFSVPFVDKFSIEVETFFEADGGIQENKFKLNPSELRQRELDIIDITNDQLTGNDYKKEEDPRLYVSKKNGRGPLAEDWITNPPDGIIMCSYKLIKVEFRYWGLQSKIERFIHDYGLRRVMLRAHRQAWAWQDEWVGLTMDDIRKLEKETQRILQRKLGRTPLESSDEEEEAEEEKEKVLNLQAPPGSKEQPPSAAATSLVTNDSSEGLVFSTPTSTATPTSVVMTTLPAQSSTDSTGYLERRRGSRYKKRGSIHSLHSLGGSRRFSSTSRSNSEGASEIRRELSGASKNSLLLISKGVSTTESDEEGSVRPEWALDQIELSDSDSDLEFFDAKDTVGEEDSLDDTINEEEDTVNEEEADRYLLTPVKETETLAFLPEEGTSSSPSAARRNYLLSSANVGSVDYSGDEQDGALADTSVKVAPIDFLFLVLHGGSIMDPISDRVGKTLDFSSLHNNLKTITDLHFRSAIGRIAMRMVPCKNVCSIAFHKICDMSPVPIAHESDGDSLLPKTAPEATHNGSTFPTNFLPMGTIPLIATQCFTYKDTLRRVTEVTNKVYREFLESDEGQNFNGQVCLIGDCMGSVLGYDILTSSSSRSSKGTPSPPPLTPSPTQPPRSLPPGSTSRQRKTSAGLGGTTYMSSPQFRGRSNSSVPQTSPSQSPHLRPQNLTLDEKQASLSSLNSDRSSNTSINISCNADSTNCLFFDVTHFFAFGSPLGLVLAHRRAGSKLTALSPPPRPSCQYFYNIFYGIDTIASRLEPLLDQRFAKIDPITVPRYRDFPTGSDEGYSLKDTVVQHPYLFVNPRLQLPSSSEGGGGGSLKKKAISSECLLSMEDDAAVTESYDTCDVGEEGIKPFSVWWSSHRIDYRLETHKGQWGREAVEVLPTATFTNIVHSRYWEAKELVSFILRQVLRYDSVCVTQRRNGKDAVLAPFVPRESVVKWKRKTTNMRISHMRSNHRATDVVALEGIAPPSIPAKFQYGPLDMASLCKEQVEMYALIESPKPTWEYMGTDMTDKHGKVMFNLSRPFPPGLYPVKLLVKGDHTTANCNLFVVPPYVEAVVFSVDGALASNFSISAKDMKLKHGSVEVARSWQELGYLIIYITGRPDWQKDYILNFLGCHGFPLGMVVCAESFSGETQSSKTAFLAKLIKQAKVIIHSAYGSARHLGVYKELGLQSDQIYIHGKKTKVRRPSDDCQYLKDGFATHHSDMVTDPPRKAMHDARDWFGDACFSLPGHPPDAHPKKSRGSRKSAFRSQKSTSIDLQGNGGGAKYSSRKGKLPAAGSQQADM